MEAVQKTKWCTMCQEYRWEDDFYWKNRFLGIRHSSCKIHQREYDKEYYKNNREAEIERVKKSQAQRIADAQNLVNEYLRNHRCTDCGQGYSSTLTFDHVRGKKKYDISDMVSSGNHSISAIIDEIAKCEVVCANCHLIREEKRRRAKEPKRQLPEPSDISKEWNQYQRTQPKWFLDNERSAEERARKEYEELRRNKKWWKIY